ncbi:MAG: hypothetical protein QOJ02_1625 [Acidobacteriota bacterium]|jgi:hypothetical protein|nr:hypothetical protein [Acidobacteriota bacterium]
MSFSIGCLVIKLTQRHLFAFKFRHTHGKIDASEEVNLFS